MANTAVGSLIANDLVPVAARAAGALPFGPVTIPAGLSVMAIMFDLRQVTSLSAVFSASVELSIDGGASWLPLGGSGLTLAQSGYVLNGATITRSASDPLGPGPVRVFGQFVQLKRTDLSTRQIRGSVSCSEAATSGVTFAVW